jgi:pilus assembly protein CpaB
MAQTKKKGGLPLTMIMGAVGFGIAAALLSVVYLKARERAILESLKGPEQRMVAVVVANRDLPRGAPVEDGSFAVREIPAEYVHADAVLPGEYERFKGRAITTALGVGRPLLKSFLDEEFPVDFSDTIPVGHRALTVTVDEVNSVAGMIRPGNRIDILVNIPYQTSGFDPKLYSVGLFRELPGGIDLPQIPGGVANLASQFSGEELDAVLASLSPGDVIVPVLQNVRVLATGQDPYIESLDLLRQPQLRAEGSFTSVTVDVTAEQAALLTAAQDKGDLLALLRNRKDPGATTFTAISARDLFDNAVRMAAAEEARSARATAAGGVDRAGNLVDADGKKLASAAQLAAAGLRVNENGQVVDASGKVVDPKQLVVTADGKVLNREQLAAAGLAVNAAGQIVDANGNVVSAADIVTTRDGRVLTKQQLAAAGLAVDAAGEVVDSRGRIVDGKDLVVTSGGGVALASDVVTTKDGRVLTKQQLAAAGLSVNAAGDVVDASGRVVQGKDLVVTANGSVVTKEQLAASGLTLNDRGEVVDAAGNVVSAGKLVVAADGSVLTEAQLDAAGLAVNERGEVVDASGNVVDRNDLVTAPDGTVLSRRQLAAAGYAVREDGQIVDKDGNVMTREQIAAVAKTMPITGTRRGEGTYDYIIGGASKDGIAKSQRVPVPE